MKLDYSKRIKGICYCEDVYNREGKKATKIVFNDNAEVITEAMTYLRYTRITATDSYNTLNRIAGVDCQVKLTPIYV
jgi:hypothetical protein